MTLMILFGLLIGVLSSFSGLGGGFLVVPFLIYMEKKTQLAVGTSFLVVMLIAVSAVLAHGRLGNIDYKTGLYLALGGVVGAQIGPLILQNVSDQMFKRIFACLLVGIGVWMFISSRNPV